MNKKEIKKLVGNKIFTVVFTKKNGDLRKMNCRLNVQKHLKGGSKSFNDDDYDYLTVYDLHSKGYRTVNLNTIKKLKFKGKEHING